MNNYIFGDVNVLLTAFNNYWRCGGRAELTSVMKEFFDARRRSDFMLVDKSTDFFSCDAL